MSQMRQPATAIVRRHIALVRALHPATQALARHPLYPRIRTSTGLRVFMRSHVFAVWDFMTLLKRLQRDLTCLDTPWRPVADPISARFVNEIVLGEESDEVRPGVYMSHFSLYLAAMEEEGADRAPIDGFMAQIARGASPTTALEACSIPAATRAFVGHTLATAQSATHEVAASFLLGRETIIPDMFGGLLQNDEYRGLQAPELPERLRHRWEQLRRVAGPRGILPHRRFGHRPGLKAFQLYLERHIELDGESHGPMGERLLMALCGDDSERWRQAEAAAGAALAHRHAMWDAVAAEIDAG